MQFFIVNDAIVRVNVSKFDTAYQVLVKKSDGRYRLETQQAKSVNHPTETARRELAELPRLAGYSLVSPAEFSESAWQAFATRNNIRGHESPTEFLSLDAEQAVLAD